MSETSNTTPSSTPAGWYPHPGAEGAPGSEMYWDGTTWRTDLVRQPGATDAAVPAHATVTAPSKRPWYTRKAVIIPAAVVVGLIVIGGIGSALGGGRSTSDAAPAAPVRTTEQAAATAEAEAEPVLIIVPNVVGLDGASARAALEALGIRVSADGDESMPVIAQDVAEGAQIEEGATVTLTLEEKPQLTLGQQNAIRSAQSYLDFTAFSRAGLFEQLTSEYGEGFEAADAEFAIAHLEQNGLVDWNAEAAESAQSYLDFTSFSRQGLYEQLTSEYGEQFTPEQAEYALTAVGY
ncbi:Ltp family lipoprotein [Microbacterium schleiferi]|uniref:Ltp family lipoprotein n=1 Tax=Microbacterium schleiferi TaxID=69362 RepID=UPI0035C7BC8E